MKDSIDTEKTIDYADYEKKRLVELITRYAQLLYVQSQEIENLKKRIADFEAGRPTVVEMKASGRVSATALLNALRK